MHEGFVNYNAGNFGRLDGGSAARCGGGPARCRRRSVDLWARAIWRWNTRHFDRQALSARRQPGLGILIMTTTRWMGCT